MAIGCRALGGFLLDLKMRNPGVGVLVRLDRLELLGLLDFEGGLLIVEPLDLAVMLLLGGLLAGLRLGIAGLFARARNDRLSIALGGLQDFVVRDGILDFLR
jgi:hypothetical protein